MLTSFSNLKPLSPLRYLGVWLFMLLASSPAWGATVDLTGSPVAAISDQACVGTRARSSLGCTAKEFTVNPVFSAAPGTPPFCVAGNSFNFLVDLELSGSNADRYNIIFYTGQTGNAPDVYDPTQLCTATAFPLTLPAPWSNLDSNTCADYNKPAVRYLRVNPKGTFNGSNGTNNPDFTVTFKVIVN